LTAFYWFIIVVLYSQNFDFLAHGVHVFFLKMISVGLFRWTHSPKLAWGEVNQGNDNKARDRNGWRYMTANACRQGT
jgi:hypothetical protein